MFKHAILFILCLVPIVSIGQVELGAECDKTLITDVEVLEDPTNQMKFEEVHYSSNFERRKGKVLNLGVSQSSFWIRFNFKSSHDGTHIISIDQTLYDSVEFHVIIDDSVIIEKQGKARHLKSSSLETFAYATSIDLDKGGKGEVYIRIDCYQQMIVPIYLSTEKQFIKDVTSNHLLIGAYASLILVMVIYNLFLFLSVRDRDYLIYAFCILSIGLIQLTIKGFGIRYIWIDNYWIEQNSSILFANASTFFTLLFANSILKLKQLIPNSKYVLLASYFLLIISIILMFLGMKQLSFRLMQLGTLSVGVLIITMSILVLLKGHKPARFFLLGWSILIMAIFLFLMRDVGLIPYNFFTQNSMIFASSLETVLFSFALADKINIYKEERLVAVQEKEQLLLKQNTMLETRVNQRTEELALLNKELKRQALSAQIDPHFIFNALNSIQNFILKSDKLNAQKYLSKFARLMRFHLNSSLKKYIPLQDELDAITSYLELEKLRFENRFEFEIRLDANLDTRKLEVPSMLLIPFLENAVWHGILPREGNEGVIGIDLKWVEDKLAVKIKDNGIGIRASEEQKNRGVLKQHQSAGVKITKERLELMHSYTDTKASFKVDSDDSGTLVSFLLPVKEH